VLAGLAAQAWEDGLGGLSDDELIGVLCAARRVCSWQTALEFAAVAELDVRRMAQVGDVTEPRAAAHTSEELAAALVLTGRAADMLLDLAAGLARLPAVAAELAAGVIDRGRAVVFVDELAALDAADAVDIAATVLPRAAELTTGQLRAPLRRAVLAFDPAVARRRRERAAASARVEIWPESSGNTALACRELSPADALAADRHTIALARSLKTAGASGSLDQLQAAVCLALLSGQSPQSLLPAPAAGHRAPDNAAGRVARPLRCPGHHRRRRRRRRHDLPRPRTCPGGPDRYPLVPDHHRPGRPGCGPRVRHDGTTPGFIPGWPVTGPRSAGSALARRS